jgi:Tol biopolymer transport system component
MSMDGGLARLVWARDRLLYAGIVRGRPAILGVTPGAPRSEEVVLDAVTPAATSDGATIVFVSSSTTNPLELWTADASGRRVAQLAPAVTASQVMVTPDDRSVLYTSLAGGTPSIWMTPIAGGPATKVVDGGMVAVSPDGRSIAFTALGSKGAAVLSVCGLPGCDRPRTLGAAQRIDPLHWTPDGRGVAIARAANLWVYPIEGGAPRQLTRFTDPRPIRAFAWSRDGRRLAIARSTTSNDIVLLTGVK